ncbi:hypothetical protein EB796_006065 [Bugula neritina]|uniref:Uncharacterized protein n=1 Tax=Bugula neritina TaxID=10212 RepID=A0A7J7KBN3_BUGNE|nr:hypothetical protein EB796_006065 [Bugula neritina]
MSTVFLAPYFDKVLGVDVSGSHIGQATLKSKHKNVECRLQNNVKLQLINPQLVLISFLVSELVSPSGFKLYMSLLGWLKPKKSSLHKKKAAITPPGARTLSHYL